MLAKPLLFIPILCAVGCLICFSACKTQPSTKEVSLSFPLNKGGQEVVCPLAEAAHKMYATHVRAINAGREKPSNEILEQYWTEEIKGLKPIRVYTHRANIVVVQHVSGNIEEGKYISIPVSSYLPMNGQDGFMFSPIPDKDGKYHLGDGVFDFKRK
jgi:hypothetical protein